MTKKHEELVEEIIGVWKAYDGVERAPRWAKKLRARRTIALTLTAVRDGRLDEELGVVGRFDFHINDWATFEHWVAQALHDDASIFIALRGTGKEEE